MYRFDYRSAEGIMKPLPVAISPELEQQIEEALNGNYSIFKKRTRAIGLQSKKITKTYSTD